LRNAGGVSTPGDDNLFRVVVRWTKEEGAKDQFGFVVQNDVFGGWVNSTDSWFTTALNYFWNLNQYKIQGKNTGVYLHPGGGTAQASLRSVTIDTASKSFQYGFDNLGQTYRFAVKVSDGSPIAPYRKTNLKVEVYNTHTDPTSIYKPDNEFYITSATGSTNDSALFWHVFDLKKEEGSSKYKLVPVELIKSTDCELLDKPMTECGQP